MMPDLPDGKRFRRQVIALSYWFSVPAVSIVLLSLMSLLELTWAQWQWFLGATAVYAVVITPLQARLQMRFMAPIRRYLDDRLQGEIADEISREAFARVIDLPRFSAVMASAAGWCRC